MRRRVSTRPRNAPGIARKRPLCTHTCKSQVEAPRPRVHPAVPPIPPPPPPSPTPGRAEQHAPGLLLRPAAGVNPVQAGPARHAERRLGHHHWIASLAHWPGQSMTGPACSSFLRASKPQPPAGVRAAPARPRRMPTLARVRAAVAPASGRGAKATFAPAGAAGRWARTSEVSGSRSCDTRTNACRRGGGGWGATCVHSSAVGTRWVWTLEAAWWQVLSSDPVNSAALPHAGWGCRMAVSAAGLAAGALL
jgi:hypothetical protein